MTIQEWFEKRKEAQIERRTKDMRGIEDADPGIWTKCVHCDTQILKSELEEGGFKDTEVHGIMGGAWLARDIDELWDNEESREALMNTVRLLDGHDEIIGLSGHLLGISVKSD